MFAQNFRHGFVDVEGRTLRYLGVWVTDDMHGALHTRRLLLGKGWTVTDSAAEARMMEGRHVRTFDSRRRADNDLFNALPTKTRKGSGSLRLSKLQLVFRHVFKLTLQLAAPSVWLG